jgi:hypothetical protein
MSGHASWRAAVLYGIFVVLLIARWHELPEEGDTIPPWYVIIGSAAVPGFISRLWK